MLETQYQKTYAQRRWEKSFPRHMDEIGVLGPWLTLAHMVWAETGDLPLLAERGSGIAHNPSSNLRLRSGIAGVEQMLGAGITVGVGLDAHSLDSDQDYLRELRLAHALSNKPGASAPTITARQVWEMGTTHGAAITFGKDAPLGKLTPGFLADLVLYDYEAIKGAWTMPDADPIDTLLRQGNACHVRHVMTGGNWVIQDRLSTSLDEQRIINEIRQQLSQQTATSSREQIMQTANALAPHVRKYYQAWDKA